MEHPLITDVSNLNSEELYSRITDLQRKLVWAQRYNGHLAQQIAMALETYNNRYQQLQREQWEKSRDSGTDFSDRIDIS